MTHEGLLSAAPAPRVRQDRAVTLQQRVSGLAGGLAAVTTDLPLRRGPEGAESASSDVCPPDPRPLLPACCPTLNIRFSSRRLGVRIRRGTGVTKGFLAAHTVPGSLGPWQPLSNLRPLLLVQRR